MIILTGASGGIGKKVFDHFEKNEPIIGITHQNTFKPSFSGIVEKIDLNNSKEIEQLVKLHKSK